MIQCSAPKHCSYLTHVQTCQHDTVGRLTMKGDTALVICMYGEVDKDGSGRFSDEMEMDRISTEYTELTHLCEFHARDLHFGTASEEMSPEIGRSRA